MIGLSDYFDRLLKIGTGWLGWTEQQTLETRIQTILLAKEGVVERLRFTFGTGEPEAPKEKPSPEKIMAAFRQAGKATDKKSGLKHPKRR